MKETVKAILPEPAIRKAIQIRDWARFVTMPQKDFNPTNLCSSGTLSLSDIYQDEKIGKAWAQDHEMIVKAYGDEDNLGGVNPGDRRALYYLTMALNPKKVLEIGTHIGASTLHIARALKQLDNNGIVTSADIIDVNHPDTGSWKNIGLPKPPEAFAKDLECSQYINFHVGPCMDLMEKTTDRYDFIFLDGDHAAHAVYQEISTALPLLNKNGVILLHDFFPDAKPLYPDNIVINGPFKALDRIKREGNDIEVLPLGNLPWPTKQGTSATTLALVIQK